MKLLKTILLSFLIFSFFSCSQRNYTIIENVDVFDGKRIHEKVNFVFADSFIIAILPKSRRYKHATIIDGTNMTILPPFLNAHVHVRNPENLKEAMQAGVFGLLDMFSTDRRANYLRTYSDSLDHSKFYSSNIGGTVAGGHGTQFRVTIPVINDTLSGKAFVLARIDSSADYIKITQEQSMAKLSMGQLQEIVETAHGHDKKVVGHISALSDGLDLADQGVDGLAHIWYRKNSIATAEDWSRMAKTNLFIIPTLSVIEKVIHHSKEIGVEAHYLTFEEVQQEVRKAYEAGIKLLAGTDAPNYGMDYSDQLFKELVLLNQCGISELEVLKMATTNIYESFDLEEFDILKEHTVANFILVQGKPHKNIAALKGAKRIWKKGKELSV